ncbi:MAG: hypothetical protein J6Y64_10360 [Ruminococcus sp.]|nr:hypothetical protein [Ruminococcus sp.]
MKINRTVSKLIAGSLGMLLAVGALPDSSVFNSMRASAETINAYGTIDYNTDDKLYVYTLYGYIYDHSDVYNGTPCITIQDSEKSHEAGVGDELNIYDTDEENLQQLEKLKSGESYDITFESKEFYDFLNTESGPSFEELTSEEMGKLFSGEWTLRPPVNPDLGFDPFENSDPGYTNTNVNEDPWASWGGWSAFDSYTTKYYSLRADKLISVKRHNFHYYGDINSDEVVDSFDRLEYGKYINGCLGRELTKDEFLNADINEDKRIDEEDYKQVTDFILGKESEFNTVKEIGSLRLGDNIDVQRSEGKESDEAFAEAQMKFGVDLLKQCFDPKGQSKNVLVSPFSISSSLSMMANGADNNTLKEMEEVLGGSKLSLEDINEYMAYFLSRTPDEDGKHLNVANSLWCKDADYFKPLDSFLETDKKYYGAEVYKTNFDDATVTDINSWVNKNTNGMIPTAVRKSDFSDLTRIALINTLYFDMEWDQKYDKTTDGKFTDLDGNLHNIKEMKSKEYLYYELEDADAFKKPYLNGDYYFLGIMPRDKDIIQYVNDLDAEKLSEALTKPYESEEVPLDLNVMIPEFEYDYSTSLPETLKALGINDAFDKYKADFSRLCDRTVPGSDPIYLGDVIHKTKIEVSKEGTKAAAVTVSFGNAGGMPPKMKTVNIRLDKPFVYMLVDKNNIPLFVGAVTQLDA